MLTKKRAIGYASPIACKIRRSGLAARFYGGHTASQFPGGFFVSIVHGIALSGRAVWEAFGPAGSVDRSANPHGLPFLFSSERGGEFQPFLRSNVMYELSGLLLAADTNRTPKIVSIEDIPEGLGHTGDTLTYALSLLLPEFEGKALASNAAIAVRLIALSVCSLSDCCDVIQKEEIHEY